MITEKQRGILNIINNYIIKNKMSLTVRDLCKITEVKSTLTIHGYLKRLENQGYIYKKVNSERSIRLTDKFYEETITSSVLSINRKCLNLVKVSISLKLKDGVGLILL